MAFQTAQTWDDNKKIQVNALKYRNHLAFINDYRDKERQDRLKNVTFVEVLHKGWPHIMVIVCHEIKPGEQLLIDYGQDYWDDIELNHKIYKWHMDEMKAAVQLARDEAISEERARIKKLVRKGNVPKFLEGSGVRVKSPMKGAKEASLKRDAS